MHRSFASLAVVLAAFASGCSDGASTGAAGQNENEAAPFDLMHTRPECAHEGHPDTWCTRDDAAQAAEASGMEKRIVSILSRAKDPAKATITIAYFSFSNRAVYNKLCEMGKAGFSIEGFFDQSYRTQMPAQ